MNNPIIDKISEYLKIETSYTVILSGDYGTGKTFFFKNVLVEIIKKTATRNDARKNYSVIHISLFGIDSIDDIQKQILLELIPLMKNGGLKLTAEIVKSIGRAFLGDLDQYLADSKTIAKKLISYENLVLCIDDIDRKSDNLSMTELFGFINSIVENQNAKVILIANEKELLNDENYTPTLKEKVVGVSIQYIPLVNEVFQEIISTRYKTADKIYFTFLEKNAQLLINAIQINDNNFRNLIYLLEHFKTIFYELSKYITENKDFKVQKEEKLLAILEFTLAIAIEYKMGRLNSANFMELQQLTKSPFERLNLKDFLHTTEQNVEIKESYSNIFIKKYYTEKQFLYFESILYYILGLKSFNIIHLVEELERYFVSENGKIPESEKILTALGYRECYSLSTKDYNRLTRRMIELALEGKYHIEKYGVVFHFATRFKNMLNINISKLKNQLKRAIKNHFSKSPYVQNLSFRLSYDPNIEFAAELQEIINYCVEINDQNLEHQSKTSISEFLKLFANDFNAFASKVNDQNDEFRFSPFWLETTPKKVFATLQKLNGNNVRDFAFIIERRYRQHIYEKLHPEKKFLIELKGLINIPTKKRKIKNLKNVSLDFLSEKLTLCISNFPAT